jgi:hypothetical protein
MKRFFLLILCFSLLGGYIYAADAKLSWDANAVTPDGYKVYYGTSSGNYTSNINAGTATTATITSLNFTTKYYFAVKAYNASGESGASNEVYTFLVSGVASTSVTPNGATITWTTDGASDTQVGYGTTVSYGSLSVLNSSLVTSHSVVLTGLLPSTLYHFKVMSKDTSGNGVLSNDYTFTTGIALPLAPTTLRIN